MVVSTNSYNYFAKTKMYLSLQVTGTPRYFDALELVTMHCYVTMVMELWSVNASHIIQLCTPREEVNVLHKQCTWPLIKTDISMSTRHRTVGTSRRQDAR